MRIDPKTRELKSKHPKMLVFRLMLRVSLLKTFCFICCLIVEKQLHKIRDTNKKKVTWSSLITKLFDVKVKGRKNPTIKSGKVNFGNLFLCFDDKVLKEEMKIETQKAINKM